MKILDTCFLIDLQRELRSGKEGPASAWIGKEEDEELAISVISQIEFLEGFAETDDGEMLLRPFRWLSVNPAVSRQASRLRRSLRLNGNLIGDFDILIASSALVASVPLVTRDTEPFGRIEGLRIINYLD